MGRWENRKGTADLTSGQPSRPCGSFLLLVLQLPFEILNLGTVPLDQCLGINNLFLRGIQLKGEPDAINGRATATWVYAPYLNLLDPLCELQCARGLRDCRNFRIYRAYDRYPRVAGQGGLQHPCQLGVPERHMITVVRTCRQPKSRKKPHPGVLLFTLGGVLGQGRNHAP
jgi:hypothetical protein